MRRSSANRRHRLANPWAAGALALGIVAILAALFPHALWNTIRYAQTGAVSLAYKRALVQKHPEDVELRLSLASSEIEAGLFDAAESTLAPLKKSQWTNTRVGSLLFSLVHKRWQSQRPNTRERMRRQTEVVTALQDGLNRPLPANDVITRAHGSFEVGRPDLAAKYFLYLAVAWPQGHTTELVRDCEQIGLHSNQRCAAFLAVKAAAQADNKLEVAGFVEQVATQFAHDEELLARTETALRGRMTPPEAARWWRLRLAGNPQNAEVAQHLIDVDLALGNLEEALTEAEKLATQDPKNHDRLQHAAEISGWAGYPARSLRWWRQLAALGDVDAQQRALQVAAQLHDEIVRHTLLLAKLKDGKLEGPEVKELVAVVLAVEPPDQAIATLRQIRKTIGWTQEVADPLAKLLESSGNLSGALAVRTEAERHRNGELDVMERAQLLWRQDKPEAALDTLRRVHSRRLDADPKYWRLIAALAWHLDRQNDELAAYEALRGLKELHGQEGERYLALIEDSGRAELSASLCRQLWEQTGESRFLLLALDQAIRANRWDRAGSLVDTAETRHAIPVSSVAYWRAAAEVEVRRERIPAAIAAFDHVLALTHDPTVPPRMLWLALSHSDDALLARLLGRWEDHARNEPALWRTYASGLQRLGRLQESLGFFQKEAEHHPDDAVWLLGYADVLDHLNMHEQAGNLRRIVYPMLGAATTRSDDPSVAMAHASLATELRGAAVAYPWVRLIADQAQKTPAARSFALSWLLAQGRTEEARTLTAPYSAAQRQGWSAADRLAAAMVENDRAAIASVAAATGSALTPTERVAALHEAGQDDNARRAALVALEHQLPMEQRDALATQLSTLPQPPAPGVSAAFNYQSLEVLSVQSWRVGGSYGGSHWGLALDGAWNTLSPPAGVNGEHELGLGVTGTWNHSAQTWTKVALGLNWRPGEDLVWQGQVSHQHHLGQHLDFNADLLINDLETGSAALRLSGARDRLAGTLVARLDPWNIITLQLAGLRYVTRDGQLLASGGSTDFVYQRTLIPHWPLLRLRATGSAALNSLSATAPDLALGPANEWIPTYYLATGVGLSASTGELDDERRRLRLMADAWGGWMWPLNRPVYRISAGVGVHLFRGTELVVDGYSASDQPISGGQAFSGLEIKLNENFGR